MLLRRRQHRWIALLALLGLLFQQVAMAAYVCPSEMQQQMAAAHGNPPCHQVKQIVNDRARCEAHCNPQLSTLDLPSSGAVVPVAILNAPAVVFAEPKALISGRFENAEIGANACAPPLRTRYCSLLI